MFISKITHEGIYYKNESGRDGFCNFQECNANWLSYRKRKESLSDSQVAALKGKDKCIGQRDVTANQCFIEIFTRTFTKFEFALPEEMTAYQTLREAIHMNEWTTHDLS
jgi:hypothetical protein